MSTGVRVPLAEADRIAAEVVDLLRPYTTRIEVAGSVRRRKPDVGDLEFVAVPAFMEARAGLFDHERLDTLSMALDGHAIPRTVLAPHPRKAWGDRYKKMLHVKSGLQVDLFIVRPPACFSVLYLIRTGSADFSRRVVTALLANGMRCSDGRILRDNEVVDCPDEQTFFNLAGMKYLPPEERT